MFPTFCRLMKNQCISWGLPGRSEQVSLGVGRPAATQAIAQSESHQRVWVWSRGASSSNRITEHVRNVEREDPDEVVELASHQGT